jgi:hypothetical protein
MISNGSSTPDPFKYDRWGELVVKSVDSDIKLLKPCLYH